MTKTAIQCTGAAGLLPHGRQGVPRYEGRRDAIHNVTPTVKVHRSVSLFMSILNFVFRSNILLHALLPNLAATMDYDVTCPSLY